MYEPPSAVQTFYANVPGSKVFDPNNGFYSSCNNVLAVAFSWRGWNGNIPK
jgi:cathepsin D